MTQRYDFENRLGQGLKRWAQAGEPTLDLEALVKERLGEGAVAAEQQVETAPTAPVVEPGAPERRGRWTRWVGSAAAAAALVLTLGATFPTWAGAAAGWPIVGPVLTEIIMKDAGLQWAYDNGLIQGTLAEAQQDGLTFRILGVMADSRRTTVIYQVQGLPAKGPDASKPIRAFGLSRPQHRVDPVDVSISTVNGQGGFSSSSPGTETPLGLVGTVSTLPLETESAELEVTFRLPDGEVRLTVPASRAETDKYSREVVVNQSQEIDGVKITLEAVTYTPAETVVRYVVEKPPFNGTIQWEADTEFRHVVAGGEKLQAIGGGSGINHRFMDAFPPVKGQAQLVFPVEVKGVPVEASWPLTEGSVTEVLGVPVTLTKYEREGKVVAFEWTSPESKPFGGIAGFEVVDKEGKAYSLDFSGAGWSSESNYVHEGILHRRFSTELPDGVEPVAVRATRAAVVVKGPWVFELPR